MRLRHFAKKSLPMDKNNGKVPVSVSPTFLLLIAFSVFLIPVKWVLACTFAALIHELSHYWALRICGCSVFSVYIGVGGARISTEPMTELKESICALAGPLGGLMILFLAPVIPTVAVCALFQSIFNLLPIYPMDGGRALYCLLLKLFKTETADRIITIWTLSVTMILVFACVVVAFWKDLGLLPIVASVILAAQSKKSLANRAGKEYNVFSYGFERKPTKCK